ncbi:hypothetical protein FSP39_023867 [Pinctada imbricata]|uniref:Reverse transcriptase domain-containing protein n=1 Tax=Pinctada imbricata TaxID=66713 RepID=A0AA88XU54_PINIB|nr:hypothetical protein FSP39_023867 [Pinctada imbricata]
MDREHYKKMVMDQLNDRNFYHELTSPEDARTMNKIKKFTSVYADSLTDKEIDYLNNFEMKSSNFYGLPKIHKSKEIQHGIQAKNATYVKLPQPGDLKLRPIVAGPACPTHRLSNLLDIILKALCKLVPSYIRDDIDFLNYIPDSVDANTKLISFDVTSLYTNIPHDVGMESITYWIEKHRDEIPSRFTNDFIIDGLKLVLENNHFFFDNKYFLQIKGTAMGTKVAPTYATLFMGYLEEKLFSRTEDVFDANFGNCIRKNWKRYLDDCFIFWNRSLDDLNKFHDLLNGLHTSIQFTMEQSEKELPFLDTLIIKEDNKITTDLFYKSTDTHQYLIFSSCHPSHTKRNIPFNLTRRICTIVSYQHRREKRLKELKSFLLKQNYPVNLIDAATNRAKEIPLPELRDKSRRNTNSHKIIPFVTTHNPRNKNVFKTAKTCLPILHQSDNLRSLINQQDIINSRRQPPNLKRLLTKARFTTETETHVVSQCQDPRCGTCPYIQTGQSFTFKNGKVFHVNAKMNCKSKNLIYEMTCPNCGENYVGQTGTKLADRVRVHKQQIRDPSTRNTPCSGHFDMCGGGSFSIFPFYKVKEDNEQLRKAKENYFIEIFKPKLNC